MKTICIILISVVVFAAPLCVAGTVWHYKCETPNCGFEGDLEIGGGFIYEEATGYCTTCRKLVSIRWKRKDVTGNRKKRQDEATDLLENAPEKVGTVWNSVTGRMADLYPCPYCKKPFMKIGEASLWQAERSGLGNIFCPSCAKPALKFQHGIVYD
jgi:hypothetical protein